MFSEKYLKNSSYDPKLGESLGNIYYPEQQLKTQQIVDPKSQSDSLESNDEDSDDNSDDDSESSLVSMDLVPSNQTKKQFKKVGRRVEHIKGNKIHVVYSGSGRFQKEETVIIHNVYAYYITILCIDGNRYTKKGNVTIIK